VTAKDLPPGIATAFDDLGAAATLAVDLGVYTLEAVLKTAYWHTDRFFLYLHRDDCAPQRVLVEMRGKDGAPGRDVLVAACGEFANALLDQTVRQRVLAETRDVRDALLRKAFGEGRAHGDPDTLRDPSRVPSEGTFESDPADIRGLEEADAVAH
jgi:His-Xaa-Ser system protein HxsD